MTSLRLVIHLIILASWLKRADRAQQLPKQPGLPISYNATKLIEFLSWTDRFLQVFFCQKPKVFRGFKFRQIKLFFRIAHLISTLIFGQGLIAFHPHIRHRETHRHNPYLELDNYKGSINIIYAGTPFQEIWFNFSRFLKTMKLCTF